MRFLWLMNILILVISCSSSAYAGEIQRIKLKDGSVINAEVISMQNGVYTLKSPSLGEFNVSAKKIQSISAPSMTTLKSGAANAKLNQLQSALMSNPQTKNLISGLKNDPAIQAILSDPKIMKAIQNHDYNALANNPKFQNLMNDPTIKQIAGSVSQ